MSMVMTTTNLHFILVPWLAQGPMIDIARLLAARGVTVSIVTTPSNLSRIKPTADIIAESNLPIHFISFPFPAAEFGLPEGCENIDSIPMPDLIPNFFEAAKSFKNPLALYLRDTNTPPASCIVSDYIHGWTAELAREFGLPRIVFQGFSCFAAACIENLHRHKTHETVSSDTELLVIPGLPHRIELNRTQLPGQFKKSQQINDDFRTEIREAELRSEGILVNSFEELEIGYSGLLEKTAGKKVWMIGPVSMIYLNPFLFSSSSSTFFILTFLFSLNHLLFFCHGQALIFIFNFHLPPFIFNLFSSCFFDLILLSSWHAVSGLRKKKKLGLRLAMKHY